MFLQSYSQWSICFINMQCPTFTRRFVNPLWSLLHIMWLLCSVTIRFVTVYEVKRWVVLPHIFKLLLDINCIIAVRHPDDGHIGDRNTSVRNNMWLNIFINVLLLVYRMMWDHWVLCLFLIWRVKRISENCNVKTIFKARHNFGRYLRSTKPWKDVEERSQCVYKMSCECCT
jgi:hypothetical protein